MGALGSSLPTRGAVEPGIPVHCAASRGKLTDDGNYLFVTCSNDRVARIDLRTPTPTVDYIEDLDAVFDLAVTSDGGRLYVSSLENQITMIDMHDPMQRRTVSTDVKRAVLGITSDDSLLAAAATSRHNSNDPYHAKSMPHARR